MMTEEDRFRDPTANAPAERPPNTVDPTREQGSATTYHQNGEQSFVYTVIHKLATTLDEDPMEMRPRLGDVIDPEILVRLRQTDDRPEQTFTFTYRDHVVTATNYGSVSVRRNSS